jgi:hypothetical protein
VCVEFFRGLEALNLVTATIVDLVMVLLCTTTLLHSLLHSIISFPSVSNCVNTCSVSVTLVKLFSDNTVGPKCK